jgi:hypothetical protein
MVARWEIPIRQPSVRWGAACAGMTEKWAGMGLDYLGESVEAFLGVTEQHACIFFDE